MKNPNIASKNDGEDTEYIISTLIFFKSKRNQTMIENTTLQIEANSCHNLFVILDIDDALSTQQRSTKFRPWTELIEGFDGFIQS